MPQDVFANTSANWWEGGQKVKPGEKFQPRKLNTPLDKLARKHAGRRSLTKTERKHGRYIKARPAGDKKDDIAFDATFRAAAPYQGTAQRNENAWPSPSSHPTCSARSASSVWRTWSCSWWMLPGPWPLPSG